MVLRWIVAIVAALVLEGVALHFLGVSVDRILPPPAVYIRATSTAVGTVTGKVKIDTSTQFWNTHDQWVVQYTFDPVTTQLDAKGRQTTVKSPTPVHDSILVDSGTYTTVESGQTVTVKYDPDNPSINGIPETLGKMSRSDGLLGVWLMYPGILIVLAFVIEASLRGVIRDL